MKFMSVRPPIPPAEPLFYVQDSRSFAGDCVLWWRAEGAGYTCRINEAGKFTALECVHMRATDVAWPVEVVDTLWQSHVTAGRLPERRTLAMLPNGKWHGTG